MIGELVVVNWGPFRGTHRIRFRPGATAIVARHEEDAKRSSAVGKSVLLEAIKYAVTGEINDSRKKMGWDVDGWITRGEKEGSVCLSLEGGATIFRSKKVGQSRQVRFSRPGYSDAGQAAADEAIAKYLGFEPDDYERVSYFEQKEASRMLRVDPSVRLDLVVGWLGLGLVDRAEVRAGEIAAARWREVERSETERAALKTALAERPPVDGDEAKLAKEVHELRELVKNIEKQIDDARELRQWRRIVDGHNAVVEEGKKLRAWVDEHGERIERESALIEAEQIALSDKLAEKRRALGQTEEVARGAFDGKCPVAGIECPATETINADRVRAEARRKKAKVAYDEAKAAYDAAGLLVKTARDAEAVLRDHRTQLERMRAEVKANADAVKIAKQHVEVVGDAEPVDDVELGVKLHEAREHLAEAEATIRTHKRLAEMAKIDETRLERVIEEAEKASEQHTIAHRAREIFRLARRRVAERALGDIEADANEAVAAAGVDLKLGVRWEKEAKKPATECAECGAPFPESKKVKECARCGAVRGMHTTPRLDFMLSDSSGGYDDLAGISLQLSAGAWLLAKRSSPWSSAILDEPTSAMDAAIRRGLVRYLATVANRGKFRQLLVVSHSSDFVDALPNRIEIIRNARGDRQIVS